MASHQPGGIVVGLIFFLETSNISAGKFIVHCGKLKHYSYQNEKIKFLSTYSIKDTTETKIGMGRSKIFESRVLITLVPRFYLPSVPQQVAPDIRQKLVFFSFLTTYLDLEK